MPQRSVNERLLTRTVAHHIELQRLAAGAVQQAFNRLTDSDAEIYDVIRRRSNDAGIVLPWRTEALLGTVRNINNRVYRDIGNELSGQLNELARYEVDFSQDLFEDVLPFRWQMMRPRLKLLRSIIDEEPMHGGLLSEWVDGMATGRFDRIRSAIRTGVAVGETSDAIIRRIRGRRSLNYRDGVLDISRRSTQRVISTMFNHVANRARLTLFDENNDVIQLVVWTAVLDDATCSQCAALDGEQYSLEQAHVIEESAGGPPLHPNCRCTLSPVIGTLEDFDIDPEEVGPSVRQMMDGRAPDKLSYQQWLEGQSREKQDDILGKDRAVIFRRGIPVKKFIDHTGKRYTLAELKQVEAKTMATKPTSARPAFTSVAKRRNYGWTPDLPDQRDLLFAVEEPKEVALPVRMSLRDKMPPVWDQGSLGSCTANAILAAAMYAFGADTPMLSRLDLYYKERVIENTVAEDAGAEIRDGIKALAKWGVCTEATWPYKVRSFRQQPPKAATEEDDKYKIKKYMRLKSHEDFMRCLTLGYPFIGGFSVYENFDDAIVENKGILPIPTVDQKMVGGHAVTFVGFDSQFHDNPAFKESGLHESQVPDLMYEVRNSFGAEWGDGGYFWMPAPYVETRDLSDDFWMIMT